MNENTDQTIARPYPDCVINRLLYVGRYYSSFLPGAKRSITRERKRYEKTWPGVNAFAFRILDETTKAKP